MKPMIQRVLEGRHTVVLGGDGTVVLPPELEGVRIDIDCRRLGRPLEPLVELERQARRLLGANIPPLPGEASVPPPGKLGEWMDRTVTRSLVNHLGRLAAISEVPLVVVLHAAQTAHPSTLKALSRLVRRGALPIPLVIGVDREDGAEVRELVRAVRDTGASGAVLGVEGAQRASPPTRHDARNSPPIEAHALPGDLRLVLRAAAALDPPFDVEVLGHLLRRHPLEVLESLQRAVDLGVDLEDLGGGRLALPPDLRAQLATSTLPSLTRAWDAHAARLMADTPTAPTHRTPVTVPPSSPPPRTIPSVAPRPEPDAARAAEHAERAGDVDLAVEQLTRAARHASDLGGFDEALSLVERGYEILDGMPRIPTRTRLRVGLDLQLARIHWMAAGDGEEFSLPSALGVLDRCLERLGPDDPAGQVAEIHRTIAGIRYDMGDAESLELALKALTAAERTLTGAGEPLEAARLLNDEAAVWLRIGDPVRANHLLERSREVFERMVPDRAEARQELAQTDHLLAKLLLTTPPRPDKEREALSRGVEYATGARDTFAELGLRADAARVEETLGRLAHRSGKLEEAVEHLLSASHTQRTLGDAIGLARSSEALAELLTDAGDPDAALDMLQRSIVVNLQKGSPQGAVFNRRGLTHLLAHMPEARRRTLAPILERLDTLLREATSTP